MAKIGHQPCRALRSGGPHPWSAGPLRSSVQAPPRSRRRRERLPVAVADDVAALVVLFDVPGRREAAAPGWSRPTLLADQHDFYDLESSEIDGRGHRRPVAHCAEQHTGTGAGRWWCLGTSNN